MDESATEIPAADDLFVSHQLLALARASIYIGKDHNHIEGLLEHLIDITWGSEHVLLGLHDRSARPSTLWTWPLRTLLPSFEK